MIRAVTGAALLLALASAAALAQAVPAAITIGDTSVPRAGQARRLRWLGLDELYVVTIYVDGSLRDTAHMVSPDTPKALRIDIRHEDDIRRAAVDWRPELVPRLPASDAAHLRGTFAPLRRGDVVLVRYQPRRGTTVLVNSATAVSGADHDLMAAFLDHWIGQQPVSDEVKQALLGPP